MIMALPIRKKNRLEYFDYGQNGAYFVTICTKDRKPLLCDIVGDESPVPKPIGKIALAITNQIPKKYPNVKVDTFVVMPNHIHLLLSIENDGTGNPSPTVGTVVAWYKYSITKQANMLLDTIGQKVFQRSYHDHIIRNEKDYAEIWEYIENNPRKWALDRYYSQPV